MSYKAHFMPRKPSADLRSTPSTTAQKLGSVIQSARKILRKDKGLSTDLDRLPLLTWVMFLKFLDDLETQTEQEAKLAGKSFKSAINEPYRWRDWAANPAGITGDELLAFINQEEAIFPDGSKGPGLFSYLRALTSSNGDARRDVVATVFQGVDNRMKSGYLLRDVLNKIHEIHFTSSEELHTLGTLYESMLREMRDAAGDSGEFYTPRPVVRLMVNLVNPRLGETVLDPAAGTGGFLVESFAHFAAQVKTIQQRQRLQERSIFGCEAKPLPYLLCQMNLLLHGLDAPKIDPENALRFKLTEIGDKERVDVILTNPPFGGEEEKGIQGNFPEDMKTSETSLLFIQLIVRRLKRAGGRGAFVVPDGFLSNLDVAARVKSMLLESTNVHTIVRLPFGVFEPYTPIKTNLVFFDSPGPTTRVWYYEVSIEDGRKKYTKTRPIASEEFDGLRAWWSNREEGPKSWPIEIDRIRSANFSLDFRNPSAVNPAETRSVPEIADSLVALTSEIGQSAEQIRRLVREWENLR